MRGVRAAAAATLLALVAAPSAAQAARADLTVAGSAARLTGGEVRGTVTLHASGSVVTRTSVSLGVRVGARRAVFSRVVVPALRRGSRRVTVRGRLPADLPAGIRAVTACADAGRRVRERSEANNCRRVLTVRIQAAPPGSTDRPGTPPVTSSPGAPTPPAVGSTPAGPGRIDASASTVPTDPVAFEKEAVFRLDGPRAPYWVYVPAGYDASHRTPTTLFVWLHGCGERSPEKIVGTAPGGSQSWISIAPGGRESDCWEPATDMPLVLTAIADAKRHFNVNARRVVLGGFSSGGDLAYRTVYENANLFAGLLAEGTSPFAGTGCPSQATCLERTAWRLNVVHLAHLDDDAYPIGQVRRETDALRDAGFPVTRVERPGVHSEPDAGDTGTVHDLRAYLLPHLDDPWLAPAR